MVPETIVSTPLPPHASVVAGDEVWIESSAVDQLARVASLPGCVRAVGMPDLHAGRGIPIGAAFRFDGVVRPSLVGTDAGCGVLLVATRVDGPTGDALERRVREAMDGAEDDEAQDEDEARALHEAAFARGPRALAATPDDDAPDVTAHLAALVSASLPDDPDDPDDPDERAPLGVLPDDPSLAGSLGTIGGGNHFAEIVKIDRVLDRALAERLGLARGRLAVLVHTGSRGLGAHVAARWAGLAHAEKDDALEGDARARYLADLRGAIRWAQVNRLLVARRLLRALGAARASKITGAIDLVHNAVVAEPGGTFLHRKGAAPAHDGEPTVVLGSRGAPSFVLEGRGSEACLCCVAHGAGRRMGRTEAYDKLRDRHPRASLSRTKLGGRVICDDTVLMYEEHPDAYKPIEPVIDALVQAGAGVVAASLVPLVTVKK
jgi:release factor H-coupled RctB family protein